MTRRPEQQIQKAVLGHLAWRAVPGTWWAHYPAGGWRSPIEAAIFKSLGVVAGIPDILIVHCGQLYALELKATGGRLTDVQSDTQAAMVRAGAIVATAHGLDAALAQLIAWGIIRPSASTQVATAFSGLRHDVAARTWTQGRSRS
jgi:hypothetical protein